MGSSALEALTQLPIRMLFWQVQRYSDTANSMNGWHKLVLTLTRKAVLWKTSFIGWSALSDDTMRI